MTGIGKTMSAVITPDPEVMAVYRKRYTQLWDAADVVRPQPPNGAASPAAPSPTP
jgi:3-hydroxy-3-methylglutaryl CoA synthase